MVVGCVSPQPTYYFEKLYQKKLKSFDAKKYMTTFATQKIKGCVAERLGRALQKLVQRFESARNLFFYSFLSISTNKIPPKSQVQ